MTLKLIEQSKNQMTLSMNGIDAIVDFWVTKREQPENHPEPHFERFEITNISMDTMMLENPDGDYTDYKPTAKEQKEIEAFILEQVDYEYYE